MTYTSTTMTAYIFRTSRYAITFNKNYFICIAHEGTKKNYLVCTKLTDMLYSLKTILVYAVYRNKIYSLKYIFILVILSQKLFQH